MIFDRSGHVVELREKMRGGDGVVEMAALCRELPAHVRLFSTITVRPGCSIGEHVHEGETELFYFISGTAVVLDDGVRVAVGPGDVMSTGGGHSHAVMNEGAEDVVMLACIVTDA